MRQGHVCVCVCVCVHGRAAHVVVVVLCVCVCVCVCARGRAAHVVVVVLGASGLVSLISQEAPLTRLEEFSVQLSLVDLQ